MKLQRLISYMILLAAAVTFIYPFLWMAAVTFKPASEVSSFGLWTSHFNLENYRAVFSRIPIGRAFLNSAIVAGATTFSVLFFSSLTGYTLARLPFRGQGAVTAAVLISMMIPGQLTLIPLYRLIVAFGWVDSYLALIIPNAITAMGILIFRQTFLTIPFDLLESARMEGATEFQILTKILLPLAVPALVTVGILTFMGSWNEVLWPMIVIRDQTMMTMPQLVVLFGKGGQGGGQIGVELAAAMLLVIPIVIAYCIFQRYFIESIATSGLKG